MKRLTKLLATVALLVFIPASAVLAQSTDETGPRVIIMSGQVATNDLGEDGHTVYLPSYLVQIQNPIGDSGKFRLNLLVNRTDGNQADVYGDILGADLTYTLSHKQFDFGFGGGFGMVQTAGLETEGFTGMQDADRSAYSWDANMTFDIFFTKMRESGFRLRAARFDAIGDDLDGVQITAGVILPGIGN